MHFLSDVLLLAIQPASVNRLRVIASAVKIAYSNNPISYDDENNREPNNVSHKSDTIL